MIVLGMALCCLIGASVWEFDLFKRDRQQQLEVFEGRLHRKEKRVDDRLAQLHPDVEPNDWQWRKNDVVLLGFNKGELVYWSDERVGRPDLYQQLNSGGGLVKLNNVFYDVRHRKIGEYEYYALIFLADDYLITNEYVRNRVNKSLGINAEDASRVIVTDPSEGEGEAVHNRDGRLLFRIAPGIQYQDRLPNYFVLLLYLLSLYLVFIAYALALLQAPTLRAQMVWVAIFAGLYAIIRWVMVHYKVPHSLYNLPAFQTGGGLHGVSLPVGDMFFSIFCITHLYYIALRNIRFRFEEVRLVRHRYLFLFVLVLFSFLYMNFIHASINSLIDNTQISLNVARIINIDLISVLAFFTFVMGGMGLLVLIDGSVRFFCYLFSLREVLVAVAICCLAGSFAYLFSPEIVLTPAEMVFAWSLYAILGVNVYLVKGDMRKSIFIVAIIMVSGYIIQLAKVREINREEITRSYYASELIQERDTLFEKRLAEVDRQIRDSRDLPALVFQGDQGVLSDFLFNLATDITGFHYGEWLSVIDPDTLSPPSGKSLHWRKDPGKWIDSLGFPVPGTSFYNIEDFDGYTTYLGYYEYAFGKNRRGLYIGYESKPDFERTGYHQILSITPYNTGEIVYPYSYAVYRDGELQVSSGTCNYNRSQDRFGYHPAYGEIVHKEGYSHLLIPKENNRLFVISLGRSYFAPYNLNILYAILICLLLTSYGMAFRFERGLWGKEENTLKRRIKNNIIMLVCVLLIITTVISVVMVSAGFENRQSTELVRLSRFILDELEHQENVEVRLNPEITGILQKLVETVQVDINIYSEAGQLVAASTPAVFESGVDGTLLNPTAYRAIVREQATSLVQEEKIGELSYMGTYLPLELRNGKKYVLCIPYFKKSDELNRDILLLVVITFNVAMVMIVLVFLLSGIVAERVTKPLQLVNERLRQMRIGGKNEKIDYDQADEVGELVKEYNAMVDELEENIKKLSRAERESAWREMARQIAHEIKNPLTPMKLNIQFLQRTLAGESDEKARERFKDVSAILIEQIDHMASIASAFSDFAKVSVTNNELFDLSEMVERCVTLFKNNVASIHCYTEPEQYIYGDKDQVNRVLVNLLKNAEQSIPEEREGNILVTLRQKGRRILLAVKDNGCGIPEEIRDRIAEPNFTTKSGGMGLGLALSYRIVESMGGNIWFESREDEGTTFYVSLKLVKN